MTIDHLVGQRVTLRGIAGDAASGAVLVLDGGTPVYVEGLSSWAELAGWPVAVTGDLDRTEIAPLPPGTPVSHGAPGEQYVLKNHASPQPGE
ncbi:hypothetical protein [Actinoplanes sp. NPDC051859]|uniref:hypothetical protein n=1 Tax=Actinoplanes sp. NPDC051859 TaxID=3363909 RepID=UPI0037AA3BBE